MECVANVFSIFSLYIALFRLRHEMKKRRWSSRIKVMCLMIYDIVYHFFYCFFSLSVKLLYVCLSCGLPTDTLHDLWDFFKTLIWWWNSKEGVPVRYGVSGGSDEFADCKPLADKRYGNWCSGGCIDPTNIHHHLSNLRFPRRVH